MQRAPLGVAVVGAGYWGPNLVRNFYASEEWTVRCVVEPDRARLERLLRLYPTRCRATRHRGGAGRSAGRCGGAGDSAAHALRTRRRARSKPASTCSSRSRWRNALRTPRISARARSAAAFASDDRSHLSLHRLGREAARAARKRRARASIYYVDSVRVNLGLFQESNVVWDLAPHDVSIINYVLGRAAELGRAASSARAFTPRFPTSHFSRCGIRAARSRTCT